MEYTKSNIYEREFLINDLQKEKTDNSQVMFLCRSKIIYCNLETYPKSNIIETKKTLRQLRKLKKTIDFEFKAHERELKEYLNKIGG